MPGPGYPAEDPLNKLQAGLINALRGDAAVAGSLPGGIWDEVPENAAKVGDYLMLADAVSLPDHTHDKWGREITQTFHIFTKSRGMKRAQTVLAAITALLDHQNDAVVVPGHRIVIIRNEFEQVIRDPDAEWRQGLVRYRINTEQLEG